MKPAFDSLLFSYDLKATVFSRTDAHSRAEAHLAPCTIWYNCARSCGAWMAGELNNSGTGSPLNLKQGHTGAFLVS